MRKPPRDSYEPDDDHEDHNFGNSQAEPATDGEAAARAFIEDAKEIANPLNGLLECIADDPGAGFTRDVLEAAAELRAMDLSAYHTLRARIKASRLVPLAAWEKEVRRLAGERINAKPPTKADILVDLADAAELFHTPDGVAFGDIDVDGHRETWSLRRKGFRRWLARSFFEATGGAPNPGAMQAAIGVLEAKAHYDAPERPVFTRVAEHEGKMYLDLSDPDWRAIEIDAAGWRIVAVPPVRFIRTAGMKALPTPQRDGSIETLRRFLNVRSDNDFVLAVSWLVAAMRSGGPYPVLVLAGEKGSAKSTFCAMMRSLIDPNAAPLRALPRENLDLFIAAGNSHLLTFDNLSGALPSWISDTLCRLATGGGFAVRQLYSDSDEVLFEASRPVLLNGIDDIIDRADLADRSIFLHFEPLSKKDRRTEKELWAAFEAERPCILGALLNAVSMGIRRLPTIKLVELPRMADFAMFAAAAETAMWPAGTFERAYSANIRGAIDTIVEGDAVANAVRTFMASRTQWVGTTSALLSALTEHVGDQVARSKEWPNTPRILSVRLRRAVSSLREIGFDVGFEREGRARTRLVRIVTMAEPSATDAADANTQRAMPHRAQRQNG